MRILIAAIFVLVLFVGTACAEPVKKSFPSIRHDVQRAPHHVVPVPTMPRHSIYYDAWGRPYAPILRPYSGQPHRHAIPRRRDPQWSPWPEYRQNPHGQGGHGKGPMFRYYYGPQGWGFRLGPNVI